MELIALLCGVFLISLTAYIIADWSIISPTFISCVIFGIGAIAAYEGNKTWHMELSFEGCGVILCGIIAMFLGEIFVRAVIQRQRRVKVQPKPFVIIDISRKTVYLLFFISMVSVVLYYVRLCQIAHVSFANIFQLLSVINLTRHSSDEHIGIPIACMNVVRSMSFNFLIYAFINNVVICSKEERKKYMVYLIMFIPQILSIIVGGSRIYFITLLAYLFFSIVFVMNRYRGKQGSKDTFKVLVKVLGIGMVVLFVLFSFMGTLSGKITESNKAGQSFLIYMGSSIVDLDIYLQRGVVRSNIPGANSFLGIFNTLGRVVSIPPTNDVNLGYIRLGNGTLTNVYTAFGHYLVDFGFGGMLVLQFILGCLYMKIFDYIQNKNFICISLTVYMIKFLYGLVGQLFAAETVSGFATVNDLFSMVVLFAFYYLIEKRSSYIYE